MKKYSFALTFLIAVLLIVPFALAAKEKLKEEKAELEETLSANLPDEKMGQEMVESKVNENWKGYPPQVKVLKFGSELRILVIPNPLMDAKKIETIQMVKLESEKGEFLGLKTYSIEETTREAEFMINPEMIKISRARVTVTSTLDGDWVHEFDLKAEEPAAKVAEEIPTETAKITPEVKTEAVKKETTKKKGWLW